MGFSVEASAFSVDTSGNVIAGKNLTLATTNTATVICGYGFYTDICDVNATTIHLEYSTRRHSPLMPKEQSHWRCTALGGTGLARSGCDPILHLCGGGARTGLQLTKIYEKNNQSR